MKTTRRSLLTMLGLGAAAAALAPAASVGAAPEPTLTFVDGANTMTVTTGNLTVSGDATLADGPPSIRIEPMQPTRTYRDDWSYLMGRIDQAKASGGGTIWLDNETYYLNQTLDLTGATNVTLMGGRFVSAGANPLISVYFDKEPV